MIVVQMTVNGSTKRVQAVLQHPKESAYKQRCMLSDQFQILDNLKALTFWCGLPVFVSAFTIRIESQIERSFSLSGLGSETVDILRCLGCFWMVLSW